MFRPGKHPVANAGSLKGQTILGWLIGGEYLSQRALIASGLIIFAVIIILGPGKVRPREHEPEAALDPEASCAGSSVSAGHDGGSEEARDKA